LDRKATKVLKLAEAGLSHGLIGRHVGLSKNTVGAILQRACGEPTKASVTVPKIVIAVSDTHSGRVSAARGARDEHSTLARHGFLVSK
jgi:hypothetical protein